MIQLLITCSAFLTLDRAHFHTDSSVSSNTRSSFFDGRRQHQKSQYDDNNNNLSYFPLFLSRDKRVNNINNNNNKDNKNKGNKRSIKRPSVSSIARQAATMNSALAIVPPDHAWDALQRVRYTARDATYATWPPCLRLFHPLPLDIDDLALQVAEVLEMNNIEPFGVTLNRWSIIPHTELLHADWLRWQQIPAQDTLKSRKSNKNNNAAGSSSSSSSMMNNEDAKIQALIAREETLGRLKLLQRQRRNMILRSMSSMDAETEMNKSEQRITNSSPERNIQSITTANTYKSNKSNNKTPREQMERQQQMYEEFNGPCVVCLEPDEASSRKLQNLRELLFKKVFTHYPHISPTATYTTDSLPKSSWDAVLTTDFRPIIPIGSFTTVTEAIRMARTLRRGWESLEFNVTDLQFISRGGSSNNNVHYNTEYDTSGVYSSDVSNAHTFASWSSPRPLREDGILLNADTQFGCDALVALPGVELFENDPDSIQEMTQLLCTQGYKGGYEADNNNKVPHLQESDGAISALEEYLQQEELDYDEGTVMAIGRTLFFSGEMREYVGMPATSHVDTKDRSWGDQVSGAARRRSVVHRAGIMWSDGEWGRKQVDTSPWGKMERRQTARNLPD